MDRPWGRKESDMAEWLTQHKVLRRGAVSEAVMFGFSADRVPAVLCTGKEHRTRDDLVWSQRAEMSEYTVQVGTALAKNRHLPQTWSSGVLSSGWEGRGDLGGLRKEGKEKERVTDREDTVGRSSRIKGPFHLHGHEFPESAVGWVCVFCRLHATFWGRSWQAECWSRPGFEFCQASSMEKGQARDLTG